MSMEKPNGPVQMSQEKSKQRCLALREPHGLKKTRNSTDLLTWSLMLTVGEDVRKQFDLALAFY